MRRIIAPILVGFVAMWTCQAGADGVTDAAAKPAAARTLHLPETSDHYADAELPAHFKSLVVRRFDNTPKDNPVTDAGATLGRVLFYDSRLSVNNTIACASCHQQKHAFSDPRRFSKGFEGKDGDRHAMPLVNVRHYLNGRFFWDERAASLEEQVLQPIQDKDEMGTDLTKLLELLGQDADYGVLFNKAFGDSTVTKERLAKALAQFVSSLISFQSKYDEGLVKVNSVRDDFPNFTAEENRGKGLFLARCAVCHLPPGQATVFSMVQPRNDGLDAERDLKDFGVGKVTGKRGQNGQFKSPSLRNIEYTGPYMHDGRFKKLEEVVEHYNAGVKDSRNLDPVLRGQRNRPKLDDEQKAALVAFLKTLSDPKFIADSKFSDPFEAK